MNVIVIPLQTLRIQKEADPLGRRLDIPRIEPANLPVGGKPGHLPLRVAAGIPFDQTDRLPQIPFPDKISDYMPVSQRLHRFERSVITGREEPPDLLHKPVLDHPVRPPFDPVVESFPVQTKTDPKDLVGRPPEAVLLLMRDDGPARQLQDLQGADDPDTVVGMDPVGGPGIPCPQSLVKMGHPPVIHLLFQSPP